MWYHYSLTVPAGTAEKTPVEKELKLTHGVIKYIGIGFPAGCKQLVKARLYRFGSQLFPLNPDEPASWDGGVEGGQYHYYLDDQPYALKAVAYAPLSSQAHTLTIFVNVLPQEAADPFTGTASILDKIKTLFGFS